MGDKSIPKNGKHPSEKIMDIQTVALLLLLTKNDPKTKAAMFLRPLAITIQKLTG